MTTTTVTRPPSTPSDASAALERGAGVAALVKAATYLVGFGVMGAYLAPRGLLDVQGDPAASLQFLLDNQGVMYGWYLVLYLVGGIALVSLVLGVRRRLRGAPALARTAEVFGHIWAGLLLASGMVHLVGQQAVVALAADDRATAATVWASTGVVQDALGGGIEVVGAVWVLLVSVAALRTRAFSLGLAGLGVAVGVAGLWTVVPAAAGVAASAFGLGFVVWFVWAGIGLLRGPRRR
ncbi:hypothetical protein [Aquipuribacter nitratireducens]|uniref:DUF4386 family protein n=1 Tax=Aquipuribacter nitratireducens TaxID=650104 RepID=A0ABW0GP66_9MICO